MSDVKFRRCSEVRFQVCRGQLGEIVLRLDRAKRKPGSRAVCSLPRKDIDHGPPLERLHHRSAPTRRGSIAFRLAIPVLQPPGKYADDNFAPTRLSSFPRRLPCAATWSSSARDVYAARTAPSNGGQRLEGDFSIPEIRPSLSGHQYVCNSPRHRLRRDPPHDHSLGIALSVATCPLKAPSSARSSSSWRSHLRLHLRQVRPVLAMRLLLLPHPHHHRRPQERQDLVMRLLHRQPPLVLQVRPVPWALRV